VLLGSHADMALVGEARDGEEALRLVKAVQPDILLLDLNLPKLNGIEVLQALERTPTSTRTVIVSAAVMPAEMRAALRHGARGILLKHTASELLAQCIRQVMEGEYWVGSGDVAALVDAIRAPQPHKRALTARELQIVTGVVDGASNKEIASQLNISEQTVKNHLRTIFEKLSVTNRVELAMLAVQRGLVRRSPGR